MPPTARALFVTLLLGLSGCAPGRPGSSGSLLDGILSEGSWTARWRPGGALPA